MSTTTNLLVTEIATSQAQKETTANNAFGVFDKAIAGRLSINAAGGSNVTLTDAQAQNAILVFTGLLTANINVIVPARAKIYYIFNNTTGSFTLTVKTSGGSGVAVQQGYRSLLYCDATNVITAAGDGSTDTHFLRADGQFAIPSAPGSGGGNVTIDTYANLPAAGNAGAVYLPTDGRIMLVDSGASWVGYGPEWARVTRPDVVSNWTWVNQGTSTAADNANGILAKAQIGTGTSVRMLVKTVPTPPYVITTAFKPPIAMSTSGSEAFRVGLVWRSSGDSKLTYCVAGSDAGARQARVYTATNETTGFTGVAAMALQEWGGLVWLRIEDDGTTNRVVYISNTGLDNEWQTLYTVARTTHHTPDQYGLAFDGNHASFQTIATYYHLAVA